MNKEESAAYQAGRRVGQAFVRSDTFKISNDCYTVPSSTATASQIKEMADMWRDFEIRARPLDCPHLTLNSGVHLSPDTMWQDKSNK